MRDGYPKAILIVVLGLTYAGVTWGVTEYGRQQYLDSPPKNFNECFWKHLENTDLSQLTDQQRERHVISTARSCDEQFR